MVAKGRRFPFNSVVVVMTAVAGEGRCWWRLDQWWRCSDGGLVPILNFPWREVDTGKEKELWGMSLTFCEGGLQFNSLNIFNI